MSAPLTIAVKGVAGGVLVLLFSLISEALSPKRFAGLFGAAPAVALAGLGLVLVTKGVHDAEENVTGMLAGCAGMFLYAVTVVPLLRWLPAPGAAALALIAWTALAAAVAVPLLA